MKTILILLALSGSILFSSCAFDIQTQCYRDPAYSGTSLKKVCIAAPDDDIFFRKNFEQVLANSLRDAGIYCEEALNTLPPTREWDMQSIDQYLKEQGFDGYLVVYQSDKYGISSTTAATTTIETTSGKDTTKKDTPKGGKKVDTSTTKEVTKITSEPAKYVVTNYAYMKANLRIPGKEMTAWVQDARSSVYQVDNNGIWRYGFKVSDIRTENFMQSYAKKLIEDLARDGIIQTGNKK
jgi:hypothetical protein